MQGAGFGVLGLYLRVYQLCIGTTSTSRGQLWSSLPLSTERREDCRPDVLAPHLSLPNDCEPGSTVGPVRTPSSAHNSFQVQSFGCGVWGVEFGVQSLGCRVWGVEFGVQSLGCRVWGAELGMWSLGFRVGGY